MPPFPPLYAAVLIKLCTGAAFCGLMAALVLSPLAAACIGVGVLYVLLVLFA